jgi:hypothetical protein
VAVGHVSMKGAVGKSIQAREVAEFDMNGYGIVFFGGASLA